MKIEPIELEKIIRNRRVRRKLSQESFYWFFHIYFSHYVKYETAPFQQEMFRLLQDETHQTLVFVAFRGSGKSTIVTMAYVLWSILGKQKKKYVVIAGQTQWQARQHLQNIKQELERNTILRNDLGPFSEESTEWGSLALVLSNYEAKIATTSTEQSIRGTRYGAHRPDLIICDDVEDLASVKTLESREKTHRWFTGDVIPSGDLGTRMIVVGNLLHEDSLIMRLRKSIETGEFSGIFRAYPLLNDSNVSLWPGKFPDDSSIQAEKKKIGSHNAWMREYMLHIVSDEEQAIHREWIQFYDELPQDEKDCQGYDKHIEVRIGVDLAISKKDTADYTAMVPAWLYGDGKDLRMYILPKVVNKKMTFPETVELCKVLYASYSKEDDRPPIFVIEDVAYQQSLPQQLESEGIRDVRTTRPGNQDKRTRLILTAHAVKSGKVLFPRQGCEELITQIVHFGVEAHDDLADAFSNVVLNTLEEPPIVPRIWFA